MVEKESVIVKRKERSDWNSYVSFKIQVKWREEGGSFQNFLFKTPKDGHELM